MTQDGFTIVADSSDIVYCIVQYRVPIVAAVALQGINKMINLIGC